MQRHISFHSSSSIFCFPSFYALQAFCFIKTYLDALISLQVSSFFLIVPHLHFFPPSPHSLLHSCTMDLGHGIQEEQLDTSPSVSSDSSWTSFDLSTDLTSVSSDQVSTPVTAPSGCKPFDDRCPKTSSSVKVSSEVRISKVAWRETSFLGSDE